MSNNEFSCLSNALLQAGLRCELLGAFALPDRVRALVEEVDVRDVRAVTVHQCPDYEESVVDYSIEVRLRDGTRKRGEFQVPGSSDDHDTYVLYDRNRDGLMKHMHLVHQMRRRHLLLCLPEQPSDELLTLARTIKAALLPQYQVRLRLAEDYDDDDLTPVDGRPGERPLVLRILEGENPTR